MDDEVINNWQSVEELLVDWSRQACRNRARSAKKAKRYRKLHYGLGIPVVIFSSIVGSAAFTQIQEPPNDRVRILAGALSLTAAVLAGLQVFLGFGEAAEKYRVVGIGYEQVEKEIEEIRALPVHLRGDLRERIDNVKQQMNKLADDSPDIPSHDHPDQTL
jgi:hypothetical protein